MFPPFAVTLSHLRLKEAPKCAINCPPNSVSLLYSAFYNELVSRETVNVDPDTQSENLVELLLRLLIFYEFSTSWLAPKLFTAPVCVFAPGSGSH